ncbi:MAG: DUF4440 domain-containing protein, partial [Paracoccaceae bacterium]
FAGVFAQARLVTGKSHLREVVPGIALLHQRFVVSGARGEDGSDLPRFAAMLSVVLMSATDGWRVVSLNFSSLAE